MPRHHSPIDPLPSIMPHLRCVCALSRAVFEISRCLLGKDPLFLSSGSANLLFLWAFRKMRAIGFPHQYVTEVLSLVTLLLRNSCLPPRSFSLWPLLFLGLVLPSSHLGQTTGRSTSSRYGMRLHRLILHLFDALRQP